MRYFFIGIYQKYVFFPFNLCLIIFLKNKITNIIIIIDLEKKIYNKTKYIIKIIIFKLIYNI